MLNKTLGWFVKIAGTVICAPVTWLVAGQLFRDIEPGWFRFIVQIAALTVVEGVFLSSWIALDAEKTAPPEIKTRYALTALGMYGGLWILAIAHGEGLVGLVFRLALGGALMGSIFDSGVYTTLRKDKAADRDIMSDWSVKRYKRSRDRELAKLKIDHEFINAKADLETDSIIAGQRRSLNKERRIATVSAEHRTDMAKLSHSEESKGFPYPIHKAQKRRVRQQQLSREEALDRIVDILRDSPDVSLRRLGETVGIGHETARRYLETLEEQGRIRRNGNISITE
jgi:predicted transcriptional regulator